MDYNFREIEPKWQQHWEETGLYNISNDTDRPKYYVLDMFPYPSGAGLHVGHPLGYVASDIYARFKRLKGFNVLHPMGFDAFGLPAEQYAIENGLHPRKAMEDNIGYFKNQLKNLGFSYDWNRQVSTCDPKYYKWTQWCFLQLFDAWYNIDNDKAEHINGLIAKFASGGSAAANASADEHEPFTAEEWTAMSEDDQMRILMNYRIAYQGYSDIWYCEALGTVLANDEVKEGVSERGGHPVEKKRLRQWFLRTTAYAERLLTGLEEVDFSNSLKEQQRNWIGKSQGASIHFQLADSDQTFEIFTTRPDTIFGATFMVLAPEHDLVAEITTDDQRQAIEDYLTYVNKRSERERISEVKTVTGAFTGAYAIHPFTNEKVPIWISEYVLASYGTGAIMAVPSDDDRDNAFADKFEIPIIDIIDKSKYPGADRSDKLGIMINSDFLNGMEVPDAIQEVINRLESKGIGQGKINYRLRDAGFSRQRYWGEPFPIKYKSDAADAVPYPLAVSELPLDLPDVESYKPSGDGRSPLANVTDWMSLENGDIRESDTMPGYAGSSWYFLRYMDPHNEEAFVSPEAEKYWQSVDLYIGGAEHAVGHLIYSRTWHKFFYDMGWVTTKEPFKKLINQGMIQGRSSIAYRIKGTNQYVSAGLKDDYDVTPIHAKIAYVDMHDVLDIEAFKNWRPDLNDATFILEDGKYICGHEVEKMSKRYHNTIDPNEMVEKYGADCFRMYQMFLGPIEDAKPWISQGIEGTMKFLRKFWRLFCDENGLILTDEKPNEAELKALHKAIKKVNEDIDRFSFNTCVSAFMVCVNELQKLKCHKKAILEPLVILLAPFAPFLTEELWQKMEKEGSVHTAMYPEHDESVLTEATYQYPISVNGKVRTKIDLPLGVSQAEVEPVVLGDETINSWLNGQAPKKFIYVPGRIINIVI